jgi:outer membrane protein
MRRCLYRESQESCCNQLYEKIQTAIDEVAKANGYTHIFNSQLDVGVSILLYAREEDDISDLVLKQLGITPPPAEEGTN